MSLVGQFSVLLNKLKAMPFLTRLVLDRSDPPMTVAINRELKV